MRSPSGRMATCTATRLKQSSSVAHTRKLEELIVHLGQHPEVVSLGLTKLWKLIYFIDARAVRELGEPVTGSEFIKYGHAEDPDGL